MITTIFHLLFIAVFHAIILPMIRDCPACLHVPDKEGVTPLQVLSRNNESASLLSEQIFLSEQMPVAPPAPSPWLEEVWTEMTGWCRLRVTDLTSDR